MTVGYLAFGSNLYRPDLHILSAVTEVGALAQTKLLQLAPLLRSPAMISADQEETDKQPDYCNTVAEIQTELEAEVLMRQLHGIEAAHGRQRDKRWGARTLDIDLLMLGDVSLSNDELTLPHPGLLQRDFVFYPLSQISPDLVLPSDQALRELVADMSELPKW